jgi:hypothetical protein
MAIKTNTSRNVFVEGRGNVSGMLAKSNEEVLSQESEMMMDGMEPTGNGGASEDHGNMPIFATGSQPFHSGRGLGRGHGTEK